MGCGHLEAAPAHLAYNICQRDWTLQEDFRGTPTTGICIQPIMWFLFFLFGSREWNLNVRRPVFLMHALMRITDPSLRQSVAREEGV